MVYLLGDWTESITINVLLNRSAEGVQNLIFLKTVYLKFMTVTLSHKMALYSTLGIGALLHRYEEVYMKPEASNGKKSFWALNLLMQIVKLSHRTQLQHKHPKTRRQHTRMHDV